ncbi:STAS domain-containing protein [Lutibacter citreus]|uniref:STAS domain-containing protein n=1 Tax=Lutibacter citreus TaxID=2138210 RepID=UPI0013005082|nr:STAS domain-containing protein [Lutibacter citreus]
MALKIVKQFGVYELEGVLNTQNKEAFKNYFSLVLENSTFIKMSINKIKDIDVSVIKFISSFHKEVKNKKKVLFIVGLKNKQLVQLFKKEMITTY